MNEGMTLKDLLELSRLLAKWRMCATLTHSQRNWLERMSMDIADKVEQRLDDPLPPF